MSERKLVNKVAVITGGNSGIGLATARLFNENGAKVVVIGQNDRSLQAVEKELGGNTLALKADVAKVEEIAQAMARVQETFGRIDILFANAGISECPPIQETDEEFFDHIMGINVKGVFFAFTKALPYLSQGASVIMTSSVSHKKGRPGDPLYAASKAAVRSLVRTLALDPEVLARNIRVNAVSPGAIKTPLTSQETPELEKAINDYIASTVPMKRWGRPEEVAEAVLYLASAEAAYLTGSEISVDGGLGES
ncbi:SDR family oxidoreductase [Desulfosporosinus sp. PR]|uniref:SDR family NAD(P)-dependent oxidoreductase n=1 Tax=Candidatus Desulfosporosinus nitrosoreducens TaxID=3401928 RepID=UPI0027F9A368|nr:SDR family oxidoreductase [Desulfosporosinus sp. PR]MDQ7094668.1 SDR family oxidoreductase [Desulfosporosinus sp. PR]